MRLLPHGAWCETIHPQRMVRGDSPTAHGARRFTHTTAREGRREGARTAEGANLHTAASVRAAPPPAAPPPPPSPPHTPLPRTPLAGARRAWRQAWAAPTGCSRTGGAGAGPGPARASPRAAGSCNKRSRERRLAPTEAPEAPLPKVRAAGTRPSGSLGTTRVRDAPALVGTLARRTARPRAGPVLPRPPRLCRGRGSRRAGRGRWRARLLLCVAPWRA